MSEVQIAQALLDGLRDESIQRIWDALWSVFGSTDYPYYTPEAPEMVNGVPYWDWVQMVKSELDYRLAVRDGRM